MFSKVSFYLSTSSKFASINCLHLVSESVENQIVKFDFARHVGLQKFQSFDSEGCTFFALVLVRLWNGNQIEIKV